ncbi:MAG: 50S ribosomal protein L25 [Candidatus Neomarinimicrobiota bacterium]
MSYYNLDIEPREKLGARSARALRRAGKIPINYYYHGEKNENFSIDKKAFYHAFHSGQHVFQMMVNKEEVYAMIKALQYHPVTEEVIHLDLMRVRRGEKMIFTLPLIFEGESAGVAEGGILSHLINSVEIECLPTEVPENIIVDVTDLEMNSVMTAADITIPEGMSLITPEETTIATIAPPRAEEEVEEVEELETDLDAADEQEEGETEETAEDSSSKDQSSDTPEK